MSSWQREQRTLLPTRCSPTLRIVWQFTHWIFSGMANSPNNVPFLFYERIYSNLTACAMLEAVSILAYHFFFATNGALAADGPALRCCDRSGGVAHANVCDTPPVRDGLVSAKRTKWHTTFLRVNSSILEAIGCALKTNLSLETGLRSASYSIVARSKKQSKLIDMSCCVHNDGRFEM